MASAAGIGTGRPAFKHPVGAPVPSNPSIVCMAERVRDFPGIKRGKDYHYHARKLMESGQMKFEFSKEITTEKIGGVEFVPSEAKTCIPKDECAARRCAQ